MKIGIIGLGLIGGSIYKSLEHNSEYEITGISRTVKGSNISDNYENLCGCELIFVCTPMNVVLNILEKLNGILPKNAIVTDVCSLKEFVSKKTYNYNFIPSHPMAGTENSGWDNSFDGLFKNATWVITPKEESPALSILKKVIVDLGAKPYLTTPKEHDEAVALISHAPMVVAQAMCKAIENNELAQNLASSGFRDTTRLALSNIEMAEDMVNFNKQNIEKAQMDMMLQMMMRKMWLLIVWQVEDCRICRIQAGIPSAESSYHQC